MINIFFIIFAKLQKYNKVNKNNFNNKSHQPSHIILPISSIMFTSRITTSKSTPTKLSPIKAKQYNHLDEDKKVLLHKLLNLFTFYSSKISKYSYKELNEKYFLELITDIHAVTGMNLVKNSLEYKDYQNIYHSKGRKSGLDFNDFLQTIPVVALYFHTDTDKQQAMKTVLQAIMLVYDAKVAPTIQAQLVDYDQPINDQTKQLILKLYPSFLTVYKIYFKQEVTEKFNTMDHNNESFQNLLKMMKDFQVYPKLINASSLFFLFNETLKARPNNLLHQTQYIDSKIQQKGKLFTLSKFIECLISTSRICFTKLKILQNPEYDIEYQRQIFKTLLQYMQTIKSTKSQFKNSIYKEYRFSFIVYDSYQKESPVKTFIVKDKVIKQQSNDMEFFKLFDKMKL